ncbi:MAG: hypothetical protein LC734_06280 [Acidobacteria bacterium]|nr:hypothetical protein [Acidobacteriota bacterium]
MAEITVPSVPNGLLTGGDIAADGTRLVLCDYAAGYEYSLPSNTANFDDIWKQASVKFDLGTRKNGEAIAYSTDGNSIFATSEGKRQPIIRVDRK